MIREMAMRLVTELRSGKHTQAMEYLHTDEGKCCLGVACWLVHQDDVQRDAFANDHFRYDGNDSSMDRKTMDRFGFFEPLGRRRDGLGINIPTLRTYNSLADANDHGATFDQIADYIEANYDMF